MSNAISKMSKDRNILEIEREPEVRNCYEIHKRLGVELYGSTLKLLENNLFSLCDQYVIRKCRFSYKFINNPDRSIKACTIISVLGLINLIIIKYSVEWWSTLHQPSSISLTRETTVHFSMLIPLGLMLFALIMYVAVIFLMKYRIETIRIKRKGIRKL